MSSKARQVSDAGGVHGSAAASAAAPKRPDAATGRRRAGAKPGCRQQLLAGSEFLPDVGTEDLDERLHGMGSGKVRDMLAACHKRKSGWRVSEIAADMHKPYTTIRDWLVRASGRGLDGLPDRKPPGRPRMLGAADHQNLKEMLYMGPQKYGFQAGSWQTRGILGAYNVRYGVSCEPHTLQRAMHRMRFSYRKPRSVPHNSASPEEQERLMRSVKKRAGIAAEWEYAVLTEDEATCNVWPDPGYGWHPIDEKITIPTGYEKESVKLFGVMGKDGYEIRAADSLNSDTFKEFLMEMREIYPKFMLVLDNASYHRSKTIMEYVASTNGDIVLAFLPPHTPQLNPIEILWRDLKKLLSGRYFKSADELKGAITDLIKTGELKSVKLMSYMIA